MPSLELPRKLLIATKMLLDILVKFSVFASLVPCLINHLVLCSNGGHQLISVTKHAYPQILEKAGSLTSDYYSE